MAKDGPPSAPTQRARPKAIRRALSLRMDLHAARCHVRMQATANDFTFRNTGGSMRADNARLDRISKGDLDALAEYLEDQRYPLLAVIRRKMSGGLLSKVEPDDIFQEVCTSAMQSLGSVDFTDRDPFLWLCYLVDCRVVDAYRRFSAKKRASDQEVRLFGGDASQGQVIDMLIASITSPSMAFSRKQKESRLWTALRSLPDEQQQALTMRYIQNLGSKEIAQQLGKSDGAVRVMLTRATKKLEQIMSEAEQNPG